MTSEFDIIERYFKPLSTIHGPLPVVVNQGDDCAAVEISGTQVFSIDTQISEVHFLADMNPADIAWRGLAAALSDLAAMGARPDFFTLALTLTGMESDLWLQEYADGLAELAHQYSIPLLGGDTTRGPVLTQTFQVHGSCNNAAPLLRSGGQPGDWILVTGTLGNGAAGLRSLREGMNNPTVEKAYLRPQPAIAQGLALAGIASAAIDISDGLLADLSHLCHQSQCGAEIILNTVPLDPAFKQSIPEPDQLPLALTGGDDYQLCVTIPEKNLPMIQGMPLFPIGRLTQGNKLVCLDQDQNPVDFGTQGYDHFRGQ